MKFTNLSTIRYDNGVKRDHNIEMDFDLSIEDFLRGKNLPLQLAQNERELRMQLFDIVLNQILPKAIKDTGLPSQIEGKWHSKSDAQIDNDWAISESTIPSESVRMRNKMKIVLDITVDKPSNAMQAIQAANQTVAAQVTDNIMNALKHRFLKQSSSTTETRTAEKNGKLIQFDVNSSGDSSTVN
jgi:hypothetical protein